MASVGIGHKCFVTSYVNDKQHGGKLVSVLTNRDTVPAVVQLTVSGRQVTAWQVVSTDSIRHGAAMGDLNKNDLLRLPPARVTTVIER